MTTQKTSKKLLIIVGLLGCGAVAAWTAQSEWKLRQLTQTRAHLNVRPRNPQQRAAWLQQNSRLARLWIAREQRNVTPELIKLLRQSQDEDIQRRTLRALGRLENPNSLRHLQAWSKTLSVLQQQQFTPTLSLALGRIEARNLKGQAKLNAIAKSVGLKWSEVVRLSRKVNAPRAYAQDTPGDEIVEETVDVLYRVGRQEQSSQALAKQLALSPAQYSLVKAGTLPVERQADALLSYLAQVDVEGKDDSDLANKYVPALPNASERLVAWLQDFRERPQFYIRRHKPKLPRIGYGLLLRSASEVQDKRILLLLGQIKKDFEPAWNKNPNPNSSPEACVYFFAFQASQWANNQRGSYQAPKFP